MVTHPFHPLAGERLEVLYVRRFPATDRGLEPAERRLTFEVLVEVLAVVAAIGTGDEKEGRPC